jgi:glycopeptide antibiotics resistance protein
MKSQASALKSEKSASSWSNRVLALAVAGILFLTLYPFRFSLHTNPPLNRSPFLLVSGGKSTGPLNAFLNILMFVPFGFGLAQKLREKGKSRTTILLLAMAAGAFLSYCIELTQIYIPTRDSGWEDVFTNTTGAVVGYILFELIGKPILKSASEIENLFERFMKLPRALWIISLYFAISLVVSALLQTESRLSNWMEDSQLVVGNDATGHLDRAWTGDISLVQFWSRALPANLSSAITEGHLGQEAESSALVSYLFSDDLSFRDKKGFLPGLTWTPSAPDVRDSGALGLSGKSWLASHQDVSNLIQALQNTNSFSIRVVCTPAEVKGSDGRIISISNQNGFSNLSLVQRDGYLVFWFRTPITVRRDQLLFLNIPDTFNLNRTRDILVSYDGSNLSVYLDGKRDPRRYELTPGTPLAQLVRHIKTSELEGYTYIYYALVFVPLGVLLGLAARRLTSLNVRGTLPMMLAIVMPSIFLEMLLVRISCRPFSLFNVFLSVLLMTAGIIWINADRKRTVPDIGDAELITRATAARSPTPRR